MKRSDPRTAARVLALVAVAATTAAVAGSGCGLDMNPADLDTNHDVALTPAEVRGTALAPVFDDVDTNDDGLIAGDEWGGRCAAVRAARYRESTAADDNAGWGDTIAGDKANRQRDRQHDRINSRVDRETDEAADSLVDKAMGAIFGD